MSNITFGFYEDTLAFCLQRNDVEAMSKIIKNHQGLCDLPSVERSLANENYTTVLIALWSELSSERRLMWLRKNYRQLHALLMYELALEEFIAKPTLETLNIVSVPMIRSASMRIMQDIRCVDDSSLLDAHKFMEEIYTKALRRCVDAKMEDNFQLLYANTQSERLNAIHSTLYKNAKRSMYIDLPSPKWVAFHGLNQFWGRMKMHPKQHWKVLRDRVASEFLERR